MQAFLQIDHRAGGIHATVHHARRGAYGPCVSARV
jgi:hypothetical protein